MSEERCFCHITDSKGNKYTVKDATARAQIGEVKRTAENAMGYATDAYNQSYDAKRTVNEIAPVARKVKAIYDCQSDFLSSSSNRTTLGVEEIPNNNTYKYLDLSFVPTTGAVYGNATVRLRYYLDLTSVFNNWHECVEFTFNPLRESQSTKVIYYNNVMYECKFNYKRESQTNMSNIPTIFAVYKRDANGVMNFVQHVRIYRIEVEY